MLRYFPLKVCQETLKFENAGNLLKNHGHVRSEEGRS